MSPKVIHTDYDFLKNTAKTFARYTDTTAALIYQIERHYDRLHAGGWQGRAAERFFAEMKELIFPVLHRLEDALQLASEEMIKVHNTFKDYEEQAARLFMDGLTTIEADGKSLSLAESEYMLVSNVFAKPAIMQSGTPTPNPTPIPGQNSAYYPLLEQLFPYNSQTANKPRFFDYVEIDHALNVANGLEQAIAEGRVDRASVDALIVSAQQGNAGALAVLYAIAFANAQGANYLAFENQTGFIYFGENNPYLQQLTSSSNEKDGGNCAIFVSVPLFQAGFQLCSVLMVERNSGVPVLLTNTTATPMLTQTCKPMMALHISFKAPMLFVASRPFIMLWLTY